MIVCLAPAALAERQPDGTPTAGPIGNVTYDLSERPGEHPLAPTIRVLGQVLNHIDTNVRDYSCTLKKRERLDGKLGDHSHVYLKVLGEPFSVYLNFIQPHKGREVLYVTGNNDGKIMALDGGWKRKVMAPVSLDPEGMIAMRGQKYPITSIGIRHLTQTFFDHATADMQYKECEVVTKHDQRVDGRSATMIQVIHPEPRQVFHRHVARIFIDNELHVPIHYDSFMWPTDGEQPPLEESYTYSNLKLNIGLDAKDFDKENPEIFRPGG